MLEANWHSGGGRLQPILETIRRLYAMGFWLEVVTLVIPGFNDSDQELTRLAEFLVSVSPDIPWHVTAFHKDYKMTDPDDTGPETLARAAQIGRNAGLRYIYAGNLPGKVGGLENTRCSNCQAAPSGTFRVSHHRLPFDAGRSLSEVQHIDSRALGPSFPRTDHCPSLCPPLMPQVRVVLSRKVQEGEIGGFPCIASKGNNTLRNDPSLQLWRGRPREHRRRLSRGSIYGRRSCC